jgi:hypothetical protein
MPSVNVVGRAREADSPAGPQFDQQPPSQPAPPAAEAAAPDTDAAGTRVTTTMSSRADEPTDISWGVANLDAADLGELRSALHEHFRRTAAEPIAGADSIAGQVRRLDRINELIQAIETVSSFHDSRAATSEPAAPDQDADPVDGMPDQPGRGLGGHRVIHGRGLGALIEPYPEDRQANGWA